MQDSVVHGDDVVHNSCRICYYSTEQTFFFLSVFFFSVNVGFQSETCYVYSLLFRHPIHYSPNLLIAKFYTPLTSSRQMVEQLDHHIHHVWLMRIGLIDWLLYFILFYFIQCLVNFCTLEYKRILNCGHARDKELKNLMI